MRRSGDIQPIPWALYWCWLLSAENFPNYQFQSKTSSLSNSSNQSSKGSLYYGIPVVNAVSVIVSLMVTALVERYALDAILLPSVTHLIPAPAWIIAYILRVSYWGGDAILQTSWGSMPPDPPSRHTHLHVRERAFARYYHPVTMLFPPNSKSCMQPWYFLAHRWPQEYFNACSCATPVWFLLYKLTVA